MKKFVAFAAALCMAVSLAACGSAPSSSAPAANTDSTDTTTSTPASQTAELEGAVTVVTGDAKAYIPMDDLVDKKAELARLQKELDNAKKQLAGVDAKLNNEKFISKAPAAIIEGARQNGEKLRERIRLIEESMKALS